MEFNKAEFAEFRHVLKESLAKVEEQFGIEADVDTSKITYWSADKSFTIKLQFNAKGKDPKKEDYIRYAEMYDLDPRWIGKTFKDFGGKTLTIVGLETSRRKFPIIVQDQAGHKALYTPDAIKRFVQNSEKLFPSETK